MKCLIVVLSLRKIKKGTEEACLACLFVIFILKIYKKYYKNRFILYLYQYFFNQTHHCFYYFCILYPTLPWFWPYIEHPRNREPLSGRSQPSGWGDRSLLSCLGSTPKLTHVLGGSASGGGVCCLSIPHGLEPLCIPSCHPRCDLLVFWACRVVEPHGYI